MNIRDIHIYQKLYHKKTDTTITVEEIRAYKKQVIAASGQIYRAKELSPLKNDNYTKTDSDGHITLCMDTPVGQFCCDINRIDLSNKTYTTSYLELLPKDETKCISLVYLGHVSDKEHELTVGTYDDITSETPNHEFTIHYSDIQEALHPKQNQSK